MAKSSTLWVVFIFSIIIALIFFGFVTGIFKNIMPTNIIQLGNTTINLNNIQESQQAATQQCSLSVVPKQVCSGNTATGTIYAEKNEMCGVYLNYNGVGAHLLSNVLTDAEGAYSVTQALTMPGKYVFSAICGTCAAQDTLTVNLCSTPDPENEDSFSDDPYSRPLCSSIINPTSQVSCDVGYCNGIHAGCTYYAASLTIPAHCACI